MPADWPVASDEHAPDGIDDERAATEVRAAVEREVAGARRRSSRSSFSVTELTAIVCSSDAGRFGCFDASSAIDATTTTPRSYAASIACLRLAAGW